MRKLKSLLAPDSSILAPISFFEELKILQLLCLFFYKINPISYRGFNSAINDRACDGEGEPHHRAFRGGAGNGTDGPDEGHVVLEPILQGKLREAAPEDVARDVQGLG